jgi:hypothetical protein
LCDLPNSAITTGRQYHLAALFNGLAGQHNGMSRRLRSTHFYRPATGRPETARHLNLSLNMIRPCQRIIDDPSHLIHARDYNHLGWYLQLMFRH